LETLRTTADWRRNGRLDWKILMYLGTVHLEPMTCLTTPNRASLRRTCTGGIQVISGVLLFTHTHTGCQCIDAVSQNMSILVGFINKSIKIILCV
jgi:hypothetical protein